MLFGLSGKKSYNGLYKSQEQKMRRFKKDLVQQAENDFLQGLKLKADLNETLYDDVSADKLAKLYGAVLKKVSLKNMKPEDLLKQETKLLRDDRTNARVAGINDETEVLQTALQPPTPPAPIAQKVPKTKKTVLAKAPGTNLLRIKRKKGSKMKFFTAKPLEEKPAQAFKTPEGSPAKASVSTPGTPNTMTFKGRLPPDTRGSKINTFYNYISENFGKEVGKNAYDAAKNKYPNSEKLQKDYLIKKSKEYFKKATEGTKL